MPEIFTRLFAGARTSISGADIKAAIGE